MALCLLCGAARAQTIRQLEDSLRNEFIENTTATRIGYALLAKDPYNDRAVDAITNGFRAYGWDRKAVADDSLAAFFQRLFARDPRNPMAYVLQARHGGRAFARKPDSLWSAAMQQALALDSNNTPANFALGEEAYNRFLQGRNAQLFGYRGYADGDDPLPYFRDSARRPALLRKIEKERQEEEAALKRDAGAFAPLARRYLLRVWRTDAAQRPRLQGALGQVAAFLKDPALLAEVAAYREVIAVDSAGIPADSPRRYFTVRTLIDTVGSPLIMRRWPRLAHRLAASDVDFKRRWFSERLAWYGEPLLDGVARPDTAYRFTWIGSFHHPAVFRLEERGGVGVLHWRAVVAKKKRLFQRKRRGAFAIDSMMLSAAELQGFHQVLDSVAFHEMTTAMEMMGIDGARWLLEANEAGHYHLVHRWNGGMIGPACRYLIGLSPEAVRGNRYY